MNNPIKNYFQKVYDETHMKPFTFLNCFLCIFLPIIGLILGAVLISSNEVLGAAVMILFALGGWAGNFVLLYQKFKEKSIGLFFLNILASIAFFCKLILWPLIKAGVKGGRAVTQANMGNITASVNASNEMGAELASTKTSAFNWFEYTGYVWKDSVSKPELYMNNELDEGSYSYEQNQEARNIGYKNAKDAQMAGRKWDDSKWI